MNEKTWAFIKEHLNDDVKKLALQHHKNVEVNLPFALEQIKGYQMAQQKLPLWSNTEGIIYPPHLSLEQCSSEATARYKARILVELLKECKKEETQNKEEKRTSLVDLTGGMGVDFSFMATQVKTSIYVERNNELCQRAEHNFNVLGVKNVKVINNEAEVFLQTAKPCSIVFLDPARRNQNGAKVVKIADCSPDVLVLKNVLLSKAQRIMVKLSPMLDYHLAIKTLNMPNPVVSQLHIVSTQNECKELVFVLQNALAKPLKVFCVNNNEVFQYEETQTNVPLKMIDEEQENCLESLENCYLYEPNASLMKAGCYALLSHNYSVKSLAPNSHLFVSNVLHTHWQGRVFKIVRACRFNKKEIKQKMAGIGCANIAVRNFSLTAQELRKFLKWKEGGDFLFGTRLNQGTHILLLGEKIK